MSHRYKIINQSNIYFITCTVVGWIDIFSRQIYRDIIIQSLIHCQKEKGLHIHGYVIMTNHIHLIISSDKNPLSDILRDFKKFTSGTIRDLLRNETHMESRKEWMQSIFTLAGRDNPANKDFQLWKSDNHPIELYTFDVAKQKLDYIHNNPVRAGLVNAPEHWSYSSALTYLGGESLIEIDMLY